MSLSNYMRNKSTKKSLSQKAKEKESDKIVFYQSIPKADRGEFKTESISKALPNVPTPVLPQKARETATASKKTTNALIDRKTQTQADLNKISFGEQRDIEKAQGVKKTIDDTMTKQGVKKSDELSEWEKKKLTLPGNVLYKNLTDAFTFGLTGLGDSKAYKEAFKETEKENKVQATVGTIAGSLGGQGILYKAVNKALAGTKIGSTALQGGLKGFGASQGAQLVADAIVQTPVEIIRAIEDDKDIDEFGKDWLVNRGIDALMNTAMGGIEIGLPKLKQVLTSDRAKKVIADKGIPVDDLVKAVDEGDTEKAIFYVNQYGQTSGQPFEQLQLPAPDKRWDDFKKWTKKNFGDIPENFADDERKALQDMYYQDKNITPVNANRIKETPFTVTPSEAPNLFTQPTTLSTKEELKNKFQEIADRNKVVSENVGTTQDIALQKLGPRLPEQKQITPNFDTRSKVLTEMPKKAKASLFDTYDRVYQELVSKNVPFERIGGKANVQASNLNRTEGAIEYSVFENQIGIDGKDIGKSVVGIFSDVPEKQKAELFDYALNVHNVDRYAQGKPVFGDDVTSETSQAIAKQLEAQNPMLAEKQQEITKYFKNLMDEWSVKSGLVSKETADMLAEMYPNYVPTYRAKDLPKNLSFGGQNVAQVIKKAKGGDSFILPIDQMMVAMTQRTIKNARKNELMNSLADVFQSGDNEMVKRYVKDVKFSDSKEAVDDILDVGKLLDEEPVLKGDSYVVNFYKDGKPAQMTVNKTMYEALKNTTSDDAINKVANIVKKYATNPMKSTITGYNPIFTVSNIMRDIPTALTFSSDPINMAKQVPDAVKEMITNGEKFRLFKAMGGTREGLIGSGGNFKVPSLKESKKVMDAVKKANPVKKIGDMNNFVETLPRFTEFLNVLEKTGDPALAVYRSAELTTDFSRHGNLTKLVDSFVPYLNPSVQGIDKFFRESTKSPLKTLAKGATVITIPTMILDQVNKDNDAYNEMSPREKNLYFNIPFTDNEGNQKFVRIPKSRELGFVFSSIYEFAARKARGQKVTGKEIADAIKENFTPVDITSSTVFTPALKAWNQIKDPEAYETNYFGSLIVPESQRNYSPGEQYDINSSGIAKAIGKEFNISPFVVDYLLNSYTGIIGQTLAPIGAEKKSNLLAPLEKKFINDPVFKSNTVTEFYDVLDKATKEKNDFYRKNGLDSDTVTDFEKGKIKGTEALKQALELKKESSRLNKISRELSDLRKEQRELKTSDAIDREKLVRELQMMMNDVARKALGEEK